jgi:hypothetical protein
MSCDITNFIFVGTTAYWSSTFVHCICNWICNRFGDWGDSIMTAAFDRIVFGLVITTIALVAGKVVIEIIKNPSVGFILAICVFVIVSIYAIGTLGDWLLHHIEQ